MIKNRLELSKDGAPKVLVTWHLPREEDFFYPLAFQFADDVDIETRQKVLEIAKHPLKNTSKGFKIARPGSSDHFEVLERPLSRLGFRTRRFGTMPHPHVLSDRPVQTL